MTGATLDSLIAAWSQASAACTTFYREVEDPASMRNSEAIAAIRAEIDQIPHIVTSNSYGSNGEPDKHLTTEVGWSVVMHRRILADFDAGLLDRTTLGEDYLATVRELIAAADARQAQIDAIEARVDDVEAAHLATGIIAQSDALLAIEEAAVEAVEDFPATTLAEIGAKIDFLARDGDQDAQWLPVIQDMRRMIADGRAAA